MQMSSSIISTRRLIVKNKAALIIIFLLTALPTYSGAADSEEERNADAVTLQHTEVWSNGNMDLISQIYAENYVGHFPGGMTVTGRGEIQTMIEAHRTAFPDWIEEVEELIAEGDHVATRYRSTATHLGPFEGNPATGKKVDISEASIYRMLDGQILEQWAYPDVLTLMQQITTDD
jgi:steroid delta-isomerase-like uncharacterized protein